MLRAAAMVAAAWMLVPGTALANSGDLAAYLRARAADGDGAVEQAASDYARALDASPGNPVVAIRTYREAVRAGDLALADRAAAMLGGAGVAPTDATLLALAGAAHARDTGAVAAAIRRLEAGQFRILAAPLRGWAALDAGGDPLAALGTAPDDIVARRFFEETRALLLISAGQEQAGVTALRVLLGNDQAGQDNRLAAARLLIGRGDERAASSLLVGGAPAIAALRTRLARGDAPGVTPSLAFGVSHLFTRLASDLAVGEPGPLSFVLTQAALRADPGNNRARLLLAGALSRDGAVGRAVTVLAQVPANSIHARSATDGRVQLLADSGRTAEASALADDAAARSDADVEDRRRLADLRMQLGRPAEAVPLYRAVIGKAGNRASWSDWLQYGAALDQAGKWPAARKALERAARIAPEEPLVLNYLGYSLAVHGEREDAAWRMIEKASRMRPDDPSITDSLGWALFLRGEVALALPLIERAAASDPASAEIGEHLGDAYWHSGRRFEARYAWRAAIQFAEDEQKERLMSKMTDGL